MADRKPASHRTRQELEDFVNGRLGGPEGRSDLVRTAARLVIQEALEEEARDALGRDYYEHGVEEGRGYRNGTRVSRIKTAEGAIEYGAPQIAGRDEPFRSEIRQHVKGRMAELERLAVEMLSRGCFTRDVDDAFTGEDGKLLLSRTAVEQLAERLWEDYTEFSARDLSEFDVFYLFVDGVAERLHPGQMREPALAAWGFTSEGKKVLLGLMAG